MGTPLDIIYCPFYETEVSIWSEMIERLGTFPMFVLMSISKSKNNIDDIIKATNLKPSTVLETINELVDDGLLIRKLNSTYDLTNLGNQYLRINNYLENFSHSPKSKVAVNAFTGIVEEIKNSKYYSYESSPDINSTLPKKVNKLLMKNHDFSNIKEYMRSQIDMSELNISDDDYDYIFYDLKPKKVFYVPYIITEETILHKTDDNEHQIMLIVPIEKIIKEITHPEIEKRRDIMKQLIDISYFEETLLSDEGRYLIKIINKIEQQKSKEPVYYECYSGLKIKYEPSSYNLSHNYIPEFKLSRRKRIKCKTYESNGFVIINHSSTMELKRIVSFKDLVQME